MNFIGVGSIHVIQTPVPDGSKVSEAKQNSDDFGILLRKAEEQERKERNLQAVGKSADKTGRNPEESPGSQKPVSSMKNTGKVRDSHPGISGSNNENSIEKPASLSAQRRKELSGKGSLQFLRAGKKAEADGREKTVKKFSDESAKKTEPDIFAVMGDVLLKNPDSHTLKQQAVPLDTATLKRVIQTRAQIIDGHSEKPEMSVNASAQMKRDAAIIKNGKSVVRKTDKNLKDIVSPRSTDRDSKTEKKPVSVRIVDLRSPSESDHLSLAGDMAKNAESRGQGGNGEEQGLARLSAEVSSSPLAPSRDILAAPLSESGRFHQFMKEQGNADLVRDAKIILKDGDSGEIRLVLRPERLGEVRISLSLEDNRIAGRIFVENSTVRQYFEENMADLLNDFSDSGFENSSLDVWVRQESGRHKEGRNTGFSSRAVCETFESSIPARAVHSANEGLVDLVV